MAEVLRSSQAVIDAKLDQWNTVLSQERESRDQTEQVRGHTDTELRQSYDNLRHELQVIIRTWHGRVVARACSSPGPVLLG